MTIDPYYDPYRNIRKSEIEKERKRDLESTIIPNHTEYKLIEVWKDDADAEDVKPDVTIYEIIAWAINPADREFALKPITVNGMDNGSTGNSRTALYRKPTQHHNPQVFEIGNHCRWQPAKEWIDEALASINKFNKHAQAHRQKERDKLQQQEQKEVA